MNGKFKSHEEFIRSLDPRIVANALRRLSNANPSEVIHDFNKAQGAEKGPSIDSGSGSASGSLALTLSGSLEDGK